MPTIDELKELMFECNWEWEVVGGKKGYKVIGLNGNSIFLPIGGYYKEHASCDGDAGYCWSSTPNEDFSSAYGLLFDHPFGMIHTIDRSLDRSYGLSVRPVSSVEPAAGTVSSPTVGDAAFYVVLNSAGTDRLAVVKAVKEACGLGLKEAKDLVDTAPSVLKEGLPKAEAEALKIALEEVGAVVEIK